MLNFLTVSTDKEIIDCQKKVCQDEQLHKRAIILKCSIPALATQRIQLCIVVHHEMERQIMEIKCTRYRAGLV